MNTIVADGSLPDTSSYKAKTAGTACYTPTVCVNAAPTVVEDCDATIKKEECGPAIHFSSKVKYQLF